MLLSGSIGTAAHDNNDGADLTTDNIKSDSYWKNDMGWDTSVWIMAEGTARSVRRGGRPARPHQHAPHCPPLFGQRQE